MPRAERPPQRRTASGCWLIIIDILVHKASFRHGQLVRVSCVFESEGLRQLGETHSLPAKSINMLPPPEWARFLAFKSMATLLHVVVLQHQGVVGKLAWPPFLAWHEP